MNAHCQPHETQRLKKILHSSATQATMCNVCLVFMYPAACSVNLSPLCLELWKPWLWVW